MRKKQKNKETSVRYIFSNIVFCLKFLYSQNKKLFLVRIISTILLSLINFIPIIFVRLIINEITVGKNINTAIFYVLGMVVITYVANSLSAFLSKIDSREVEITMHKTKLFLAGLAMKMKYSDLEEPRMKDFISLAGSINPFVDILTYSTGFFNALLNAIGLTTIIMTIQPIIFILIAAVVIVQMITDKKRRNFQYQWRHDTAIIQRRRKYLFNLGSETRFGKEVRINGLEKMVQNKIDEFFEEEALPADIKLKKSIIKFNSFNEISGVIQQAVIYLYLGYRVVFHGMLMGDFSMYMTSIEKFSDYISGLVGNYSLLLATGLTAREIRYCMEISEKQDEKVKIEKLINLDKNNYVFEFKNVYFKYPNTERMILKNINITLKAGETLSLVGNNGAGKSTFVKLLCRFYEPTKGEILLNGVNINTISYSEYIELIGVVFQDFKLFSYSVEENIALCNAVENEKLEKSIEKSGLKEKIISLPKGIKTMMFKEFDPEGIEFSGGEGQKVAIARAIYKDSPVIILDEPTSALDPIAEYEVYKRFSDMSKGKCSIYISHRLSSTRFTDSIAVFSDGEIKEYGNHNQLILVKNGIYKNMFEMQAQYYQ